MLLPNLLTDMQHKEFTGEVGHFLLVLFFILSKEITKFYMKQKFKYFDVLSWPPKLKKDFLYITDIHSFKNSDNIFWHRNPNKFLQLNYQPGYWIFFDQDTFM